MALKSHTVDSWHQLFDCGAGEMRHEVRRVRKDGKPGLLICSCRSLKQARQIARLLSKSSTSKETP